MEHYFALALKLWFVTPYSIKHIPRDKLRYDLHFWIGKYSTQDEYGTAAYKTVELDCLLSELYFSQTEAVLNSFY